MGFKIVNPISKKGVVPPKDGSGKKIKKQPKKGGRPDAALAADHNSTSSNAGEDAIIIERDSPSDSRSGDNTPITTLAMAQQTLEDTIVTSNDVISRRVAYLNANYSAVPAVQSNYAHMPARPEDLHKPYGKGHRSPRSEIIAQEEEALRLKAQADEALLQELTRIKDEFAQSQTRIETAQQVNEKLRNEVDANQREGDRETEELEKQRQILKASRAFTVVESSRDGQSLIQSFDDLNASIADFAHEVLRSLDIAAEEQILEARHYNNANTAPGDIGISFGLGKMSKFGDLTPMDIVEPLVRHILCTELWEVVFKPFAPGLTVASGERFRRLYADIRANETQERCGNWRSITYQHGSVSADDNFIEEATRRCIFRVSGLLTALIDAYSAQTLEKAFHSVLKLFQAACAVQRRAKTEYLSVDYDAYLPPSKTYFDPKREEDSQAGSEAPEIVWWTIGFGVCAKRNCVGENREITLDKTYPVKALVICNNWDPNI